MDELLEEFQHLIDRLPGGTLAGGIELLLQQLEPDRAEQLKLCGIPHQFDPFILQALVPGLDSLQAEARCVEFSRLSIIIAHPEGLAIHDEARHHVFNDWLRAQHAPGFVVASARLVEYFDRMALEASGEALENIERRRMFHLVGAEQARGFVEFEQLFRQMRYQFRLNECESLINLMHEYDAILLPTYRVRLAYHEGKLAADRCQWARAEQLFKHVLSHGSLEPELRVKAYNRLGIVYAEQRNWQGAVDFSQKALQLAGPLADAGDLICRILHDLGSAYRDSGDLTQARKFLQDSLKLAEGRQDLSALALGYNSLGTLYRKLGDGPQAIAAYDKSLEYLNRCQERFRPAQVYNNLGIAYADLRDWQKSEQYFQQSLDIKRQAGDTLGQAMTLNNLAQVYQNLQLPQRAIDIAQQAMKLFSEMRDLHNVALVQRYLGKLYRSMGRPDMARQSFTAASQLFTSLQEHNEAAATCQESEALTAKNGWSRWASILLMPVSLLCIIGLLIMISVWGVTDYIAVGDELYHQGRYDHAIEHYRKAIKINPNNVVAYNNRGLSYYYLRQYPQALSDYNKALEIDSSQAIVYNNRGSTHHELQQYNLAIDDFKRAIEIEPDNVNAYNSLGWTYNALQQYDQAIIFYRKAIELDPNVASIHQNLGQTYIELRQYDHAIAEYSEAINLEPDTVIHYLLRAHARLSSQRYEESIVDYNRFIEEDKNYALPYCLRGLAYHLLNDRKTAEQDYLKSLNMDWQDLNLPNSLPPVLLAVLYWQENKQEVARLYFERALKMSQEAAEKDYHNIFFLAISQVGLGNPEDGIANYRRGITLGRARNINLHAKLLRLLEDSQHLLPGVVESLDMLNAANSSQSPMTSTSR